MLAKSEDQQIEAKQAIRQLAASVCCLLLFERVDEIDGGEEADLLGGNVGGYTTFVKDGKLQYVHNYVGAEEFHIVSSADVPEGKCELRYEFEPSGKPDLKKGKGSPGPCLSLGAAAL